MNSIIKAKALISNGEHNSCVNSECGFIFYNAADYSVTTLV